MTTQDLLRKIKELENRLENLETQDPTAGLISHVSAKYRTNAGQTFYTGTLTKVQWEDKEWDTNNAVSDVGGFRFTAPIAGYYQVDFSVLFASSPAWAESELSYFGIYKNGSQYSWVDREWGYSGTGYVPIMGHETVYLNAGEYIEVYGYQNSGATQTIHAIDSLWNYITVTRIGGVEASQDIVDVGARATSNAAHSISNATWTRVNYEDVDYDTHGGIVTGVNWEYTVPIAGYYQVSAQIMFQSTTAWAESEIIQFACYRDGSFDYSLDRPTGQDFSAAGEYKIASGSGTQYYAAGEKIQIMVNQQSGSTLSMHNNGNYNWVSIQRFGSVASVPPSVDQSLVVAKYVHTTSQSIATGWATIINFNEGVYDTFQAVTTGAGWNFYVPYPGFYRLTARMILDSGTGWAETEFASIDVYGGAVGATKLGNIAFVQGRSGSPTQVAVGGSGTFYLTAEELINFRIYQNSGGSKNTVANSDVCWCSIEKLGPIGNTVSVSMKHDLAVGGKWSRNSDQIIAHNTETNINIDTEIVNSGHFSWKAANPERIYINQAGTYLVTMWPYWRNASTAGTYREATLRWYDASAAAAGVLIGQLLGPTAAYQRTSETWLGFFEEGDYIYTTMKQNSGGNLAVQMRLWIQLISPSNYGSN